MEPSQKIMSGEKLLIMRPYDRSVTAQLMNERMVVKPYRPKRQKPLIIFDEVANWPAEVFGIDYAEGNDKSVTVMIPKEEK